MKSCRQKFNTRVFSNDSVFLKAADCADAFGCSEEKFRSYYSNLIVTVDGIPGLVSEDDYNALLMKMPDTFAKQLHVEMTKVVTLNAEIESFRRLYGLKLAFCGQLFEKKAREKGCETVDEYISRYDFPEEAADIVKDFYRSAVSTKYYDSYVKLLRDHRVFPPDRFLKV